MGKFGVRNDPEGSNDYYVTDGNGNVVAGPCNKSDAMEIAKHLNELTDGAEIQQAIDLFKNGKSLDDVKYLTNGPSPK